MTEVYQHGGTGSDGNPGTKNEPVKTFEKALNLIPPAGGKIHLKGEIPDAYRIMNRYYPEKLFITGDGEVVTSDVTASVQDSRGVETEDMVFRAGFTFNNSIPDVNKCLAEIIFKNCAWLYGQIFAGGYTYRDISLINCMVAEVCFPTSTHAIYFSGGHWEKSIGLPPPSGINIIGCNLKYAGGRHGIQINGRFKDCKVKYNTIYCTAICAFQGMGIQGLDLYGNTFLVNNGGPIRAYDYWDNWYWDPNDPDCVKKWKGCHHPNQSWFIRRNTGLVGPHSWGNWYNPSRPEGRPAILFNNEVDQAILPDGSVMDYPALNHVIAQNILVGTGANLIEFHELSSPWVTSVRENLLYALDGAPPMVTFHHDVPIDPKFFTIADLEKYVPQFYGENLLGVDPEFKKFPEYPESSEIPPPGSYAWKDHPLYDGTGFDLFPTNPKAKQYGPPEEKLWTPGKMIPANKQAGKPADLRTVAALAELRKADRRDPKED